MTGEMASWMAVASHLKMPLQKCMRETTSTEFLMWKIQIEKEQIETTADQYYLAQIALEIRRVLSRNPNAIKLRPFIIDFGGNTKPVSPEIKMAKSKAFWFSLTEGGK